MKKVFISMPMKNRSKENIEKSIEKAKKLTKVLLGDDLEFIHTEVKEKVPYENGNQAIYCISKSLEILSQADVFVCVGLPYFIEWDAKGCRIEDEVFRLYNDINEENYISLPVQFVFDREEIEEIRKKYEANSNEKGYCTCNDKIDKPRY